MPEFGARCRAGFQPAGCWGILPHTQNVNCVRLEAALTGRQDACPTSLTREHRLRFVLLAVLVLLLASRDAHAYLGPGAGFTIVSTFFVLFAAMVSAFVVLLTWPFRWVFKKIFRPRRAGLAKTHRVVIVGLDGQDPELTEKWMNAGLLPNFSRLREVGSFARLGTTLPAESPVAWSSFQTGCNPGKHRIYDFLVPNRKSLMPELSSANVTAPARTLKLGKYRIPLGKPAIAAGRKSEAFWSILGKFGIFSTVLRVPITFPPEPFGGVLLSAMNVPDVKGSQGTYFYFTTDSKDRRTLVSGQQCPFEPIAGGAKGELPGPENTLVKDGGELRIPFSIVAASDGSGRTQLRLPDQTIELRLNEYTPWVTLSYKAAVGFTVKAIARFLLLEQQPQVRLYVTPIQIDPEHPALPISYPVSYSIYLAKRQGPFATLGVAEDTSGLNEGVIGEEAFLRQTQDIHKERETMFFDALDKTRRGAVVCVFDITDRMQHMFFRFHKDERWGARVSDVRYENVLRDLYVQMDNLLGRVMAKLEPETVLMVLSDHGFKPFCRAVELNRWLQQNGYLTEAPLAKTPDLLQRVDWSKTQAYAVGFGGIYLNLAGREARGIVRKEDAAGLKCEIREKLKLLRDPERPGSPISEVYDRDQAYRGPYVEDAPDLVVGFAPGYRVAWETVTGGFGESVLSDNTRPWSGDHNMNPPEVPGMLFCNRPIDVERPNIVDLAPTVLDLFGVPIPPHMDGKTFLTGRRTAPNAKQPIKKRAFLGFHSFRVTSLLCAWICVLLSANVGASGKKVVVLGIDGMDPKLLQMFMDQGRMPNFKALTAEGDFRPLQTTMPPQSPVAWSTFMTGMDPGGHGIFDFIHVDRSRMAPYSSMAQAVPGGRPINVGSWSIPTSSGSVRMLRKGETFWQMLGEHGLRSTIFRMPVNFPPVKAPGRALAGMGTPDLVGSLGTFSFYTDHRRDWPPSVSGGEIYEVNIRSNRVDAQLNGPPNTFRRFPTADSLDLLDKGRAVALEYENPRMTQDFVVYFDPAAHAAKFVVGEQEFILKEQEWSDWVHVEFEAIPHLVKVSSAARFYLKQISPKFELYVTPFQIDPEDPVMPISSPSNWSKQLCSELGRFYTHNIPEDTQAFNHGVLNAHEFWDQMMFAYQERARALDYLLAHQDEDFLFVYFGTVDQGCHMLWHFMDPEHPGYVRDDVLKDGIAKLYEMLDGRLGHVREMLGKDTVLIVMSDHGFAPFYWEVNLNTWLLNQGYIALKDPSKQESGEFFSNVDWSHTRAYAAGLNGLYVNLKGREKDGAVAPGPEYDALMDDLEKALLAIKDPRNGHAPISLIVRPQRDFHGPEKDKGPDILVGYSRGYRSSSDSPLGLFPKDVFVDNHSPWSGDHCIDYRLVPGILVTNRRVTSPAPGLADLTVSLLHEYGITPPNGLIGKDVLSAK
jgi:predicted AlkP superfamily phosphohydrolase/phosphomutase